jgi:LPS sulfotransferase NodH
VLSFELGRVRGTDEAVCHKVEAYFESLMGGGRAVPGGAGGSSDASSATGSGIPSPAKPVVRDLEDLGKLMEAMSRFHRIRSPQADHEGFRRRLDACFEALSASGEDESVKKFLEAIDPLKAYAFFADSTDEQIESKLKGALSRARRLARAGGLDGRDGPPVSITYAVCGTPRCGSSLLSKTLAATGLAGDPQEYFWNWRQSVASGYSRDTWVHWTETSWARERSMTDWPLPRALIRKASANGVFESDHGELFRRAPAHLRKLPGGADGNDAEALGRWLPGCLYVRLVRRDRIRQAVSWAIADQTGVYNSTWPHPPKREPEFDPWMVDDRHERILRSEYRWERFFSDHGLEPLTLFYEDFTRDLEAAVLATLEYLEIDRPHGFSLAPLLVKQASGVNEEWVERYVG